MNLHTNYKDLTCAILYDIFYLFLRMQIEDPWNVDTLEEFLYYCCPECKDERIQNKADFIKHALEEHPKSKVSVTKIIQVKKENPSELDQGQNLSDGIDIKTFENECDIEYFVKRENNEYWDWHNSETKHNIKTELFFENEDQSIDQCDDSIVPEVILNDLQCNSCGLSFSKADNLKRHILRIHEKRKDFKCDSCGREFFDAKSLKNHINRIHEGQKDYKCDSCAKEFFEATHLHSA